MKLRKSIRRALLALVAVLLLAMVADHAFYLYSRSRYRALSSSFASFAAMTDFQESDLSREAVRRSFGSPSYASSEDWVYRCQYVTRTQYGFPYCEILLTGATDHLWIYEVWFHFDGGTTREQGATRYEGLIFEGPPDDSRCHKVLQENRMRERLP